MNIAPGSFLYKYLMFFEPTYNLPNTVCALVWQLLRNTVMYTVLGVTISVLVGSVAVGGIYIPMYSMAVTVGMPDYMELFTNRSTQVQVVGVVIFTLEIALVIWAVFKYREVRRKEAQKEHLHKLVQAWYLLPEDQKQAVPFPKLEDDTPNVLAELVRGMYTRIKDKTCVIVTYNTDEKSP